MFKCFISEHYNNNNNDHKIYILWQQNSCCARGKSEQCSFTQCFKIRQRVFQGKYQSHHDHFCGFLRISSGLLCFYLALKFLQMLTYIMNSEMMPSSNAAHLGLPWDFGILSCWYFNQNNFSSHVTSPLSILLEKFFLSFF